MENLAVDLRLMQAVEELASARREIEVVDIDRDYRERDSLSENFVNEIEAWARHALAANGFADY